MNPLLQDIRRNPLLWMLVFVPVMFAAAKLEPEAHTLPFALFVAPVLVLMVYLIFAMTLYLLPPQAQ